MMVIKAKSLMGSLHRCLPLLRKKVSLLKASQRLTPKALDQLFLLDVIVNS
jgi:hypothetical protein